MLFSTYQRHKEMIEDKVNCHQRANFPTGPENGLIHHLRPAFLRQNLKHGHERLEWREVFISLKFFFTTKTPLFCLPQETTETWRSQPGS